MCAQVCLPLGPAVTMHIGCIVQMLLGALQKRPQLKSEAQLEEEARQLSAQAKTQAMRGGLLQQPAGGRAFRGQTLLL